jgi:hypothetical protein
MEIKLKVPVQFLCEFRLIGGERIRICDVRNDGLLVLLDSLTSGPLDLLHLPMPLPIRGKLSVINL